MKRILTLLLAAGIFTAANAQYHDEGRRDNGAWNNGNNGRDVVINNGPRANFPPVPNYVFNRQADIDRVNREYDARIRLVWSDRYLRRGEQKRITRDLDRERQIKIGDINRRCDAWDRDHRNDRRDNRWQNGRY